MCIRDSVYAGAIAYLLLVRKPREVPPFAPPRGAAPGARPPAHAAEPDETPEPTAGTDGARQPAPAAAGEPPERPDHSP